jgi:hypothetical protein
LEPFPTLAIVAIALHNRATTRGSDDPPMKFLSRLMAALCVLALPTLLAVPPPALAGVLVISIRGTGCTEGQPHGDANCFATVVLSSPQAMAVTVELSTADGSATAPADYAAVRGQVVTVPAGQLSVKVPMSVVDDHLVEDEETFFVTIANPSHGQIGVGRDVMTISDGKP